MQEESEGEDYEGVGDDSDEDLDEEEDDGEEVEEEGIVMILSNYNLVHYVNILHFYSESPARGKKRKMEDWSESLPNLSIWLLRILKKKCYTIQIKKKEKQE